MIGKTVVGLSFKGCVNYNLEKVEKGLGEILECRGVREFSRKVMIRDFNLRKAANPKLSKCVWHTALSFQDKLSSPQMLEIAKNWMQGMGLDKTQYVVLRHTDTDHNHVHIVANRIDDEGETVSDSHNWKRSEALCKELIKKYGLTPVPELRDESRINREKLRGRDLLKSDINRVINSILAESINFNEFSLAMHKYGISCLVTYNPDQSIRGLSFQRDEVRIKASDVHKTFAAKNVFQTLQMNYNQLALKMQASKQVTQKEDDGRDRGMRLN